MDDYEYCRSLPKFYYHIMTSNPPALPGPLLLCLLRALRGKKTRNRNTETRKHRGTGATEAGVAKTLWPLWPLWPLCLCASVFLMFYFIRVTPRASDRPVP